MAENAGHSHVDAITALYAAHQKGEKFAGIDVDAGPVTRRSDKELYIPKERKIKDLDLMGELNQGK